MNATRVLRPAARSLDDQVWTTTPTEIGTPVHLPPPIIVGGTITNAGRHSAPLDAAVSASVEPAVIRESRVRGGGVDIVAQSPRPLPFFPPPSWPPRTNHPREQRQQQNQQQQHGRSLSSAGRQAEERREETLFFSSAETREREGEDVPTQIGWRPHPANTLFEDAPPTPFFAREDRRLSRRRSLEQSQEQTTTSEQDETTSGTNSLSFSHSYAPTPDDPNSEDYVGIFQFVNTAHALGWSVSNQNAAERKQNLEQHRRRQELREETRSLSLKPPSAEVAENNVHVMHQICTSFERKRNKTLI